MSEAQRSKKVSKVSKVSEVSKMSKQGEQQSLHSLRPMGEGGRRPDEGADAVRSYTLETAKGGQQSLHSFAPWGEGRDEGLNDEPRHEAAEPKNVKDLTSYRLNVLTSSTKAAFTLAEVLITLAVIGIVAALTLPGLIQNHNEKTWSTAKDLWEKKLTETVRRMNTDGVMTGHETTEDFMNTFKQYMKVIKTCDHTDINKCYSPKVVTTGSNEEPLEVETDSLTSASSMGLKEWQSNTNTMSFVVADGTTVIMAYQPECPYADPIEDTGSQVSCMAYMVDVNGKKGPNRVGKDIQLSSGVAFSTCDNPIGDMCWSTAFAPTAINTCSDGTEEDKAYDPTGDANACCSTNYWAGAVKSCRDKGMSLPTRAQLAQLASELYVDRSGNDITFAEDSIRSGIQLREQYKATPTLTLSYNYWSSDEYDTSHAYDRYFGSSSSNWNKFSKNKSTYRALCISN